MLFFFVIQRKKTRWAGIQHDYFTSNQLLCYLNQEKSNTDVNEMWTGVIKWGKSETQSCVAGE